MQKCEKHQEDYQWVEVRPGVKSCVCLSCRNGVRAEHKKQQDLPLIKFQQNFWRDRPWNETEKTSPFGKAKRPQW